MKFILYWNEIYSIPTHIMVPFCSGNTVVANTYGIGCRGVAPHFSWGTD